MRGCHSCEHAAAIAEGKFAGMSWKDIPCSECDVMSGAGFAIEFDEQRGEGLKSRNESGMQAAETGKLKWEGSGPSVAEAMEGRQDEEKLPVSVMQEIVVGLLKLKPELRDVVAWRFAGVRYADIALAQGVTQACAEKRHRRALELWPALRSLFPRKVAKQTMRRKHDGSEE